MTAFLMSRGNFEDLMLSWRRQYGPFVEFQVPGGPPVLLVAAPESIREVYEVAQCHKSPRYADLQPVLGSQSMVTSEGATWRAQRDAFNPGFSSAFLKAALPGFISCTRRLVDAVGAAADRQEVLLMHHITILTTLEIICKVGFGEDVDFLSAGRTGSLWSAFEGLGRHVAWFLDNVPLNWLKNMPWNRAKTQALQEQYDRELMALLLRKLADMGIDVPEHEWRAVIGATRSSAASGGDSSSSKCPFPGVHGATAGAAAAAAADAEQAGTSSSGSAEQACPMRAGSPGEAAPSAAAEALMQDSKDILSLAVKLCRSEAGSGQLDLEMLLSQMKTFFAAGHDTTASLIGWTLYFLQQHPEAEAKLVAEVLGVLAGADEPSIVQLGEMRYLNAVLKESLRVRPPVGVLARYAPPGTTLAGYDTGGKIILVSPYVQHMDPEVWGPDAAEFRPERWLEEGGAAQAAGPYSYMPFSRGPRNCIGERFALLEAKTILAMLYARFAFAWAGDKPEEVMMSITAHPRFGVPLRVTRRRREEVAAEAAAA